MIFTVGIIGLIYFIKQVDTNMEPLINYNPNLTTTIYDRHGNLIANLFEQENREYVKYQDIPARVIESLVAIEDTLFFEHNGINLDAIIRAVFKNLKDRKYAEGASTLTQQLIKTTLLSREKTLSRKLKEFVLAVRIENRLSKEEILERYLNEVYFGHGYYGIKTASKGYFRKELEELSLKEIAILVGLPRAPSFYDPTKNYEFSLSRANSVLFRMNSLGWIDNNELNIGLEDRPKIYDDTLTKNISPFIVDEVIRKLAPKYKDLKKGGYKIYLTVDLDIQEIAINSLLFGYNQSVEKVTKNMKDENLKNEFLKEFNGAIVVMEPSSGEVLALVGGIDYKKSSFNRATQTKRQPGSSIKPFIYLNALDLGYSPLSMIPDISRTYKMENLKDDNDGENSYWKPKNYTGQLSGLITLREAVVNSKNLATINLVNEIGLGTVFSSLKRYGFNDFPNDLSVSLGNLALSPLELSGAYTIFSNYGERIEPLIVKKIVSQDGTEIEFIAKKERITTNSQAYLMIDILKDVVTGGTGKSAGVAGIEIAGKTGTTNANVDIWFCGFSPTVQTLIWYGKDNNTPIAKSITGGSGAAPAFAKFFKDLLILKPELKRSFAKPEGVYNRNINGVDEIFTDISKPPTQIIDSNEKLLF